MGAKAGPKGRTIRTIAAALGLLLALQFAVSAMEPPPAQQEPESPGCGCGALENCPPPCYRHAWWWNFPG